MKIGGIEKSSFIDFPGIVSAVLFLRGCNRRCTYCHNKELWDADGECIPENDVLQFLENKRGLLGGVVFTGGEPLLQLETLVPFMRQVKALGYKIKLDTNGDWPLCLERVLPLVDYVSLDLNFEKPGARFRECADLLQGKEWEARTTFYAAPNLEARALLLSEYLRPGEKWRWQKYKPAPGCPKELKTPENLSAIAAKIKREVLL